MSLKGLTYFPLSPSVELAYSPHPRTTWCQAFVPRSNTHHCRLRSPERNAKFPGTPQRKLNHTKDKSVFILFWKKKKHSGKKIPLKIFYEFERTPCDTFNWIRSFSDASGCDSESHWVSAYLREVQSAVLRDENVRLELGSHKVTGCVLVPCVVQFLWNYNTNILMSNQATRTTQN